MPEFVNLETRKPLMANSSYPLGWFSLLKIYFGLFVCVIIYNLLLNAALTHDPVGYDQQVKDTYGIGFLVLILIGPFCEEVAFRLPLAKFNLKWVMLAVSFWISYAVTFIINKGLKIAPFLNEILFQYLFLIGLAAILFLLMLGLKIKFSALELLWDRKFNTVFYAVSAIFALTHFRAHYLNLEFGFVIAVLYLIPTFMFSVATSFIRVRNGFVSSLIFHIAFNLPFSLRYLQYLTASDR